MLRKLSHHLAHHSYAINDTCIILLQILGGIVVGLGCVAIGWCLGALILG
jgi:hypothetical protein